ncbi:MAG: hypothetical protein IPJ47_01385 [Anaerolineales bacterium]|nr:hypothetical protein [Anaerolineales bacterium]
MNELSSIQKLTKFFVSEKIFSSMETESRAWKVKCNNCGHERSIWEMGGIRWKAYGEKALYRRCSNCGERSLLKIYKKTAAG